MAFVEARTGHCVNSHERLINVTLDFADTRDRVPRRIDTAQPGRHQQVTNTNICITIDIEQPQFPHPPYSEGYCPQARAYTLNRNTLCWVCDQRHSATKRAHPRYLTD